MYRYINTVSRYASNFKITGKMVYTTGIHLFLIVSLRIVVIMILLLRPVETTQILLGHPVTVLCLVLMVLSDCDCVIFHLT